MRLSVFCFSSILILEQALRIGFLIFKQTENTMKLPNFVKNDSWLEPYAATILSRLQTAADKEREVLGGTSLSDFAQGHKWYGLHREGKQWVIRD